MVEIKINNNNNDIRIDKFLLSKYSKMKIINIQKFIKKKEIKVNNKKVVSNYILQDGDIISFSPFVEKILLNPIDREEIDKFSSEKINVKYNKLITDNILFEDKNILVINKEYNLPVQGGTGIKVSIDKILKNLNTEETNLKLVHRLDRETTGVLIIAKNIESANKLTKMFKTKTDIVKEYLLITNGEVKKNKGTINLPLIKKYENKVEKVYVDKENGKEAITEYELLFYSKKYNLSLVKAKILTGRTHQIRVHFKELGCPILGDFKYGRDNILSDKLQLHSYHTYLKLFGKSYNFIAPIPKHMKDILNKINYKNKF